MSTPRPNQKQWNDFVTNFVVFDGETNVKYDFKRMSKAAGLAYMEFLKIGWAMNDGIMSEEEFCRINGGIPIVTFEKNIKPFFEEYQKEMITIEYNG